jgi:aminoglycoside 2''-phosphotransferase
MTVSKGPNFYRGRINECYPELGLTDLRIDESGQNNDVVVADGRLVFRFPRHLSGIDVIEAETALLLVLNSCGLPLPVPEPTFRSFQPRQIGAAFMGYRLLPGEPVRGPLLGDEDARLKLARQLATFLRSLHCVPLGVVPTGRAGTNWMGGWLDMYERMRKGLFPLMRRDAREAVTRLFEDFLRDEGNSSIWPVLIHGDFGSSNVLVDTASMRVTGIIDWGSAHVDDPAVDIAAASTIAEGLVERFVSFYPEVAGMLDRVHFYRGTFALQEALFGVENHDEEALSRGLRPYV